MQRSSLKMRILDHTETRLWEQGYRGMRVDELARDVGISKRTLYEQFRTKEEMAREALARRLDRMQRGIDEIIDGQTEAPEQLRNIIRLICEVHAKARPPFYRDLETTPSLVELVRCSRELSHTKLDRVIRSGIASGRFRAEIEPRLARRVLLAAIEGIARSPSSDADSHQIFDSIVNLLLGGLLICDSR